MQTWKTNIVWTAATYCTQLQTSFDCGRKCREKWRLLRPLVEAPRSSKVGSSNTDEETIFLTRKIEFFLADMWHSLSMIFTIPFMTSFFNQFYLEIAKDLQTCVSTAFEVAEWTITRIVDLLIRDAHEDHLLDHIITAYSEYNSPNQHLSSSQNIPS